MLKPFDYIKQKLKLKFTGVNKALFLAHSATRIGNVCRKVLRDI